MSLEWTKHDSECAQRDGWDIFDTCYSEDYPYQLQRMEEEMEVFGSHEEAWDHVLARAEDGEDGGTAERALHFLERESPRECAEILKRRKTPGRTTK